MQDKYWGYPEEFCERPYGSYVQSALDHQIANGLRDQQTLYDYDFNGTQLSPRGRLQLQKIAQRMQVIAGPVRIEATHNEQRDQSRQLAVIERLQLLGIPASEELVQVHPMIRPGLRGVEAIEIDNNLLLQTQEMGGTMMGSGSGSGAAPVMIPPVGQ